MDRRRFVAAALGAAGFGIAGCSTAPDPVGSSPAPETTPSTGSLPLPTTPATTSPPTSAQDQLDAQLRDAAWRNDLAAATRLVEQGADVNAKDDTQQSAYLIATSEGHLDLLRLCLAHGAVVNDKDSWNGTGLIRAAERGHGLVVGALLRAGIERDHVNRIGYQAIHEAVWLGQDTPTYHDTVRTLVAGGVEITRPSGTENLTPLQMAQSKQRPTVAGILTAARAAPRSGPQDAELLAAAEAGDANRAMVALRAGAGLESRNGRRRTPLLLASAANRLDVARLLVALGADVNAVDDQSDTPFLVTGVTGSAQMLDVLLPGRPNFRLYNRFGGTALIPACERGHVDYVRRAVTTGIDVNHVNRLGWTGLLEAVILGDGGARHQEIVRILLAHGADRSIPDGNGVTALEHARRLGHREIAALLAE